MSRFMGMHRNRVDAKGRVSVPASFRAWLRSPEREGVTTLVLAPSLNHPCIEGMTLAGFDAITRSLEQFDGLSPEQADLAMALCGPAQEMETDKEGRVILPEPLVAYAGLGDTVLFVGAGRTFQIWEPEAGERRTKSTRSS